MLVSPAIFLNEQTLRFDEKLGGAHLALPPKLVVETERGPSINRSLSNRSAGQRTKTGDTLSLATTASVDAILIRGSFRVIVVRTKRHGAPPIPAYLACLIIQSARESSPGHRFPSHPCKFARNSVGETATGCSSSSVIARFERDTCPSKRQRAFFAQFLSPTLVFFSLRIGHISTGVPYIERLLIERLGQGPRANLAKYFKDPGFSRERNCSWEDEYGRTRA